jgi:hypothetical protein
VQQSPLRAELVERRNVELFRLDVHNDDRLSRIANIHTAIQAIDAAFEEGIPLLDDPVMQRVGR